MRKLIPLNFLSFYEILQKDFGVKVDIFYEFVQPVVNGFLKYSVELLPLI